MFDYTLIFALVSSHLIMPLVSMIYPMIHNMLLLWIPQLIITNDEKSMLICRLCENNGRMTNKEYRNAGLRCRDGWHIISYRPFVIGWFECGEQTSWHLYASSHANIFHVIGPIDLFLKVEEKKKPEHKTFHAAYYSRESATGLMVTLPQGELTVDQSLAVARLKQQYEDTGHASMMLCGPPGTGKSTVAGFLSVALNGNKVKIYSELCTSMFEGIPTTINSKTPIIIVFDEFDLIMDAAQQPPPDGQTVAKSFVSKVKIHQMLDILNQWHGVIIIGTTNLTRQELCERYPTFVRPGRMNEILDMNTLLQEKHHL